MTASINKGQQRWHYVTSKAASIIKGDVASAISAATLTLGALNREDAGKPKLQQRPHHVLGQQSQRSLASESSQGPDSGVREPLGDSSPQSFRAPS